MDSTDTRPFVKRRSTAGTGHRCVTRTNRRDDPERLTLLRYERCVRRRVELREER
ncbi:50S ribosomal protein L33 [Nakamurella deserti]|uniref:50S ribosomal protein L33 n=1 Tax=Nakamurella deserti TaxID=2164074 RepID=UPI000DBE427A|nr:50S ribosomal protein L33 [Nakamurella deserti]